MMETIVKHGGACMHVTGFFAYRDLPCGEASARAFLAQYQSTGVLDFADCLGVYRARIDREDGTAVWFADNYGGSSFFINWQTGTISPSLYESAAPEERKPNPVAIAEFLYFGCTYSYDTIFSGVTRSDPDCYYVVRDTGIETRSKELPPLEQLEPGQEAMASLMARVCRAAQGLSMGCAVTGGVDSRSVLAHLLANGVRPALTVTGPPDHPDVCLAGKIADVLGQELTAFSDAPEGDAWLQETSRQADGMAGVCGAYRLAKQSGGLAARGIALKFGGGAGELYKNSFLNQDFPFYGGKPDWKRFLRFKVITYDFPDGICGGQTEEAIRQTPERLYRKFSRYSRPTKAESYLCAGYAIMQMRLAGISNMENRFYAAYTPLMERSVAASVLGQPPRRLEMQAWQRRQVTQHAPVLKDIPTDRGLTCDSARAGTERARSMWFLAKVAAGRVFRRSRVPARIDRCFAQGLSSPAYHAAVERCRELGILSEHVQAEQIPRMIADRVFAVGMMFSSPQERTGN